MSERNGSIASGPWVRPRVSLLDVVVGEVGVDLRRSEVGVAEHRLDGPQVGTAPVVIVCCGFAEAFSRRMHREALIQLRECGAADWPDEVIDNVVLESNLFAPYRLGQQAMTIKAAEQIMISIAFMTLEALNQGLGSCWVGTVSPREAHGVMNLPDGLFVHDLLALGYPDEFPAPRPRKEFDKLIFWEKYE